MHVFLIFCPSLWLGNLDLSMNVFILYCYITTTTKHSGLKQPPFCYLSWFCVLTGLSWAVLLLHMKSAGLQLRGGSTGLVPSKMAQSHSCTICGLHVACGWIPKRSVLGVGVSEVPGRAFKTSYDLALKSDGTISAALIKEGTKANVESGRYGFHFWIWEPGGVYREGRN